MTRWITEWGQGAPEALSPVDDSLRAADAVRRLEAGEFLVWTGDFHNARQLLAAVKRRLQRRRRNLPKDLAGRWRAERRARGQQATAIAHLLVRLEADGSVALPRAPDTRRAVTLAWGLTGEQGLVGLSALLGALSAASWTDKGLEVPGLSMPLRARYGVFSPTRHVYVQLLDELGDVRGRAVLDVGCGTGVLALVLLERGAERAVGTDIDERSVACALANAEAMDLNFTALQADLWTPELVADLVLFNAPWMPEPPRTRLDRAVYDEGGRTLRRWLAELPDHLTPGGRGVLLVSDLPERLSLRREGELDGLIAAAGLRVLGLHKRPAAHRKAQQTDDPLHAARAEEQVCMWILGVA